MSTNEELPPEIPIMQIDGKRASTNAGIRAYIAWKYKKSIAARTVNKLFARRKIEGIKVSETDTLYFLESVDDAIRRGDIHFGKGRGNSRNFPPKIKEQALLLGKQGKSPREAGALLGVDPGTISKWFRESAISRGPSKEEVLLFIQQGWKPKQIAQHLHLNVGFVAGCWREAKERGLLPQKD